MRVRCYYPRIHRSKPATGKLCRSTNQPSNSREVPAYGKVGKFKLQKKRSQTIIQNRWQFWKLHPLNKTTAWAPWLPQCSRGMNYFGKQQWPWNWVTEIGWQVLWTTKQFKKWLTGTSVQSRALQSGLPGTLRVCSCSWFKPSFLGILDDHFFVVLCVHSMILLKRLHGKFHFTIFYQKEKRPIWKMIIYSSRKPSYKLYKDWEKNSKKKAVHDGAKLQAWQSSWESPTLQHNSLPTSHRCTTQEQVKKIKCNCEGCDNGLRP